MMKLFDFTVDFVEKSSLSDIKYPEESILILCPFVLELLPMQG